MLLKHISLRKLSLVLGFFLWIPFAGAQYIYRLNGRTDALTALGSGSVLGVSLFLQHRVQPLSETLLRSLHPSDVGRFDRYACSQWNKKAALASDMLAIGSGLMYAYYAARPDTRSSSVEIGTVALQSLLMSQALSNAFKLSLRLRPYMYNPEVPTTEKLKPDGRMSFFSAHTASVSSLCFSFAFAHRVYKPDAKYNTALWVASATLPAIQGLLRVKAGKHYPSDVITGYLVGFGTSWLMHRMHRSKQ